MTTVSIAVVGGDLRFVRLCKILVSHGFDIWVYGLNHPDIPSEVHHATSLESLSHCTYIIGPIPFTRDHKNLFTPLSNIHISIELFMAYASNAYLCLSVLDSEIKNKLDTRHLHYTDLMQMDEIAILNAVPTAEGAIQYAMENSEITLNDSKCLVLGFGRCGKILAHKLKGMGANVFVEARSSTDLAYISTYDYTPVALHTLNQHLGTFDFIFNTIPVQILTPNLIDLMACHTVYIELASSPGGIDIPYCLSRGITHIPAPSLPGKVAPMTAASILYQGLLLIMQNKGDLK